MKRFLLMFLGFVYLLCMTGCSNSNSNNFSKTELSQQDLDFEKEEVSTTAELAPMSDESAAGDFEDFTVEEIANAQKIAEAYYEGTSLLVESIEYGITNTLYAQYSADYEKQNLITFTVKVKDSENPPRGIALERKNLNSDWEVLDEGY